MASRWRFTIRGRAERRLILNWLLSIWRGITFPIRGRRRVRRLRRRLWLAGNQGKRFGSGLTDEAYWAGMFHVEHFWAVAGGRNDRDQAETSLRDSGEIRRKIVPRGTFWRFEEGNL